MAAYRNLFLYGLILTIINNLDYARARQCFRCRNCNEIDEEHIEDCPLRITTPSTIATSAGSTTVDPSSEYQGSGDDISEIQGFNESGLGDEPGAVVYDIDDDDDDFSTNEFLIASRSQSYPNVVMRTLQQWRNDEEQDNSDARCVVSAYADPVTEEMYTMRDCTHIGYHEVFDADAICRELIGNGVPFAGTLQKCYICSDDLCNSAGKTAGAILLVAMCLAIKLL